MLNGFVYCKSQDEIIDGFNHTFILGKSGRLYGCGRNDLGQLGLGYITKPGDPKISRHTLVTKLEF